MPESTSEQPGGNALHQPGSDGVTSAPHVDPVDRKVVQPSKAIQEEVRMNAEQASASAPAPSKPLGPEVPEVFKNPPTAEQEPVVLPAQTAVAGAVDTVPSRPSGRWQAFWFAISALTLWMATTATSLVTRQGTLRKMLIGITDKANTELFGTQIDIFFAQAGLALMLVAVPLFIISTIFVDRYRSVHPDVDTTGMKKIAYFFMVLAVLSVIGSLSTEIYLLITNNMYKENALVIAAPIAELFFAGAYIFWLYTTVSEDRKS
ncbi:hypothetical protein IPM44_00665 [bacterium]|nr:MAG: hypothetical protein IPM44_00665 [bacterium]